jgi:hypothetical protein
MKPSIGRHPARPQLDRAGGTIRKIGSGPNSLPVRIGLTSSGNFFLSLPAFVTQSQIPVTSTGSKIPQEICSCFVPRKRGCSLFVPQPYLQYRVV